MGTLVPEDFPLQTLKNDAERRVVEAFRDGLPDSWFVVPDVGLWSSRRDFQLDIVLIHPEFGIADIEVKGHRMEIVGGVWQSRGVPLTPQPLDQASGNAYALRDRLRREVSSLEHVDVEHAVALPNTIAIDGRLPTGVNPAQVLLADDIADPQDAIERLLTSRWRRLLSDAEVAAVLQVLAPDASVVFDPEALASSTRTRLDEVSRHHTEVLERLDLNRRVAVTGAAGTGKTRLASAWATRAYRRGERTLFVCYNEPLAASLRQRLPDDSNLVIGAFLSLALDLAGMPPIDRPAEPDDHWWTVEAWGHLHRKWHEVTDRFDTIVVDEAQDFSPAWLAQLAALLDPDGPRRMLLVADEAQMLFRRGFALPSVEDGWVRAELVTNCRNAHEIARLLRRCLGGAAAPADRPSGMGVRWIEASGDAAIVGAVRAEVERLVQDIGRDPSHLLVATTRSASRDLLRAELGLVPWEAAGGGAVICETVFRAKGLEADTVLLVVPELPDNEALLYVGISRAVSELCIIGPADVADRLHLS